MSLFSFKYLWPRSVVRVDLTLFVYLWANLLHYARELSHFYLFIALVFILFFFFLWVNGVRTRRFFSFHTFVGPRSVRVGFSPFVYLWAHDVCESEFIPF